MLNTCGLENHSEYEVHEAKIIKVVFYYWYLLFNQLYCYLKNSNNTVWGPLTWSCSNYHCYQNARECWLPNSVNFQIFCQFSSMLLSLCEKCKSWELLRQNKYSISHPPAISQVNGTGPVLFSIACNFP